MKNLQKIIAIALTAAHLTLTQSSQAMMSAPNKLSKTPIFRTPSFQIPKIRESIVQKPYLKTSYLSNGPMGPMLPKATFTTQKSTAAPTETFSEGVESEMQTPVTPTASYLMPLASRSESLVQPLLKAKPVSTPEETINFSNFFKRKLAQTAQSLERGWKQAQTQLASASLKMGVKAVPQARGDWNYDKTLFGHTGMMSSANFLPDGNIISTSWDGTVRIWDPQTGAEIKNFEIKQEIYGATLSPNGEKLALGSFKILPILNLKSGKIEKPINYNYFGMVSYLAFSPNGQYIAVAQREKLIIFDAQTGQMINFGAHLAPSLATDSDTWSIAYNPDGNHIATGSSSGKVRIIDLRPSENPGWLPTGQKMTFGQKTEYSSYIKLGTNETPPQEGVLYESHTNPVTKVLFSPDGKLLVSASTDGMIKVQDVASKKKFLELLSGTREIRDLAFSPDGKELASASQDGTIRIYDTVQGKEIATLTGLNGGAKTVSYSQDGQSLVSTAHDNTIVTWKRNNTSTQAANPKIFSSPADTYRQEY